METVSQTVNMYVYTQKTPLAKITRSYRAPFRLPWIRHCIRIIIFKTKIVKHSLEQWLRGYK